MIRNSSPAMGFPPEIEGTRDFLGVCTQFGHKCIKGLGHVPSRLIPGRPASSGRPVDVHHEFGTWPNSLE